jgi:hypothetical protein
MTCGMRLWAKAVFAATALLILFAVSPLFLPPPNNIQADAALLQSVKDHVRADLWDEGGLILGPTTLAVVVDSIHASPSGMVAEASAYVNTILLSETVIEYLLC